MNIKEKWGNDRWENATTEDLIKLRMSDFDGGEIETLRNRTEILTRLVAHLIDRSGMTDQEKLEFVDLFYWVVEDAA